MRALHKRRPLPSPPATAIAAHSAHSSAVTAFSRPSSCKYVDRAKMGSYPPHWDPLSPTRVIGHVQWNGMRDGADAGTKPCGSCFQLGKDIQIVTAQNACGPLCGYPCAEGPACLSVTPCLHLVPSYPHAPDMLSLSPQACGPAPPLPLAGRDQAAGVPAGQGAAAARRAHALSAPGR